MPLLDSFKVDHTRMLAPAVRLAKLMQTPKGDCISVFDLRFTRPNVELLPERGIHTMEHLIAGFMREHLNNSRVEIIDISPMGCRTGFYMSVVGEPCVYDVKEAWEASMRDVLRIRDESQVPELNIYQCGTAHMHSVSEAQEIAQMVLDRGVGVMNTQELLLKGL